MKPLKITAKINGEIALPQHGIHFDAVLAGAIFAAQGRAVLWNDEEPEFLELPIEFSKDGYYMCSTGSMKFEQFVDRFLIKRPVTIEAQEFWAKEGVMNIQSGPNKALRRALATGLLKDSCIDWFAIGDKEPIEEILKSVRYIGKKRGIGCGFVESWKVEVCEIWPDFPIIFDGAPLRNLPYSMVGIDERKAVRSYQRLIFPYWHQSDKFDCLCPLAGA